MSARGARARFVGRVAEQAALREAIASVAGRGARAAGRVIVLEGEAGIGKSTLLGQAVDLALDAGLQVVLGGADELGRTRPFATIAEVLGARGGTRDPDLAHIVDLLAAADGEVGTGHRLHEACVTAIEHLAMAGPAVLACEDVHWADASSLTVLRSAVRIAAELPLLVLLTMRPRPRPAELQAALDEAAALGGLRLAVPPLADDEAEALVGPIGRSWNARAAGNPFFLLELAAVGDGADDEGLATAVHDVVLRRVRQLEPPLVDALRSAAVLGNGFALTELAGMLRRPVVELLPLVSEALAAGVLEEGPDGLRFRHDLIREALHRDLPRSIAAALHLEAGWVLARAGAEALRVAPHLIAGAPPGDAEAVEWLRAAARDAGRRDLAAGVDLLDAAADIASARPDQAGGLLAESISLLAWSGRLDEAVARGERLLERPHPPDLELSVRRSLAEAAALAGRNDLAARHALAAARLTDRPAARAELEALATLAMDDAEAALAICDRAAETARTAQSRGTLAVAQALASVRATERRRLGEAVARAGEGVTAARAVAASAGDGRATARLLFTLQVEAGALNLADRSVEALDVAEEARRLATSLGAEQLVDALTLLIANLHLDLGAWDDAVTELEAYLARVGPAGEDEVRAARYVVAVGAGDLEAADRWWAERGELRHGPEAWDQFVAIWRGRHLELAGRPADALAQLRRTWETVGASGTPWMSRTGTLPLVRLALDDGDAELAAAVVGVAERLADADPEVPMLRGTAALGRALLERDLEGALAATDVMRPVNDPLRVGSGLLEAARLARSLGDVSAAQRLAEEAAAVLEAIDAGEEAMARALLRDLAGGVRRPTPKRPRSGWESLTATELRVVAAVVDGCSNPQVAERLFVSRHTVESHLKHIYVKLGITSRVELAAEAVRRAMTANP